MTRYSRKKGNNAPNRSIGKRCLKTKRYKKDTDQILNEIKRGLTRPEQKRPYEMVDELPGGGNFFCIECDRFFVDASTLNEHRRSKKHKQRIRELKDRPYDQEEADRAGGMGSYNFKSKDSSMEIDKPDPK